MIRTTLISWVVEEVITTTCWNDKGRCLRWGINIKLGRKGDKLGGERREKLRRVRRTVINEELDDELNERFDDGLDHKMDDELDEWPISEASWLLIHPSMFSSAIWTL